MYIIFWLDLKFNYSKFNRQIVSGVKYSFTIKFAPTNCEKHENLSILKTQDCVFVSHSQTKKSTTTTTTTKSTTVSSNTNDDASMMVSLNASVSVTNNDEDDLPKSRNCKINVHDQPWRQSTERYKVTEVNCF